MATTDKAAIYDVKFLLYFLEKNLLPKNQADVISIAYKNGSINDGIFQRDRLLEKASIHMSRGLYVGDSRDRIDYTDKTEGKSVTIQSRTRKSKPRTDGTIKIIIAHTVRIQGISNKIGMIRCMAYDPFQDEFRFYVIWDYDSVRNYDVIEFDINSDSSYTNGKKGMEVSSFEEMATMRNLTPYIPEVEEAA